MSAPDPTGYNDSPDTSDGPVGPGGAQQGADEPGAAAGQDADLTTDAGAQQEDSVLRPGNEPD